MKTFLDNFAHSKDKADPSQPQPALVDMMDQRQKQIDQSNFDLLMSELAFDLESFKVYRKKVVQAMSSRARKTQDWKGECVQQAQQAAEKYLAMHVA